MLQILGGLDKEKLEKVTNMVKNMSSDELASLAKMMGINNKNNGWRKDSSFKHINI